MNTNFVAIPDRKQTWKGKTYQQLSASMKKNTNSQILTPYNMKNAPPLKIYRKEIVTSNSHSTSRKISIDDLNMPGGANKSVSNLCSSHELGYVTTLHAKETVYGIPNHTNICCVTDSTNALKRVRRSGIVKPSYNYNTKQYLERRKKTFEQNSYNFPRNVPDQSSGCVTYKPNNKQFQQQGAVDSSTLIGRKVYDASHSIKDPPSKKDMPFPAKHYPSVSKNGVVCFKTDTSI